MVDLLGQKRALRSMSPGRFAWRSDLTRSAVVGATLQFTEVVFHDAQELVDVLFAVALLKQARGLESDETSVLGVSMRENLPASPTFFMPSNLLGCDGMSPRNSTTDRANAQLAYPS